MRILTFRLAIGLCSTAAVFAGCSGSQLPVSVPAPAPQASGDRRIIVKPGQSIQAAVDRAQPGDTIFVEPGTYHEPGRTCSFDASQTCAVDVAKDTISLVGRGAKQRVIIDNPTGLSNGIAVGKSAHCSARRIQGSRIAGFLVKGFKNAGISLSCVDDWELAYNGASDDALYGFSASFVGHGRLHDSLAEHATRAGIYIGLSRDVRVDHNVSHANVIGFELREAVHTALDHNTAFYNTAGIFESIMPGDLLERSHDNTVSDNVVQDNNRPNKCSMPSDPVCLLEPGVGIAVIGGARNVNLRNRVANNTTFGIAVLDVCTAFGISASKCDQLGFDPLPRDTQTKLNIALQNGVDLLWSANGHGNCWLKNRSRVRSPRSLPRCTDSIAAQ